MVAQFGSLTTGRRRLLKAGAVIGGLQVASPFIIKARGETPVKIGFIDPITGSLSALAVTEVEAAKWTVEHINKTGGILGRPVELLVEDSAKASINVLSRQFTNDGIVILGSTICTDILHENEIPDF